MKIFRAVEKGMDVPENLDELDLNQLEDKEPAQTEPTERITDVKWSREYSLKQVSRLLYSWTDTIPQLNIASGRIAEVRRTTVCHAIA